MDIKGSWLNGLCIVCFVRADCHGVKVNGRGQVGYVGQAGGQTVPAHPLPALLLGA